MYHNQVSSNGAQGEYRAEEADIEESADKSAKWSGVDSEVLAAEAEAMTTGGGGGWDSATWVSTEWGTQDTGAVGLSGDAAARGGDTRKATSASANEVGAGGARGRGQG